MDLAALSVMMGQPMGGGSAAPAGGPGGSPAPSPAPTGGGGSPDSGSPLDAAFPDAGYGQILGPDAIKAARQAALFRAGLALMAAGGPRPKGTRNVGADLMQAFDPSYFNSEIDRQTQAQQMSYQLQGRKALQQITANHPALDPNESLVGKASRIASMAADACALGPIGLQACQQLSGAAKSIRDTVGETELVDGSGPTGERGKWLISKESGERLQFYPIGTALTPSEQASQANDVRNGFMRERAPLLVARQSYQAFNTIYNQVKSRSAIDPQQGATLVSLANDVLHPGTHIPEEQLMAGQTAELPGELGHLINAILDARHMTPEQARSLKEMVDSVAPQRATESNYVANHWRGIWNAQVGPNYGGIDSIDDPWSNFKGGAEAPAPAAPGTGRGSPTDWSNVFPYTRKPNPTY